MKKASIALGVALGLAGVGAAGYFLWPVPAYRIETETLDVKVWRTGANDSEIWQQIIAVFEADESLEKPYFTFDVSSELLPNIPGQYSFHVKVKNADGFMVGHGHRHTRPDALLQWVDTIYTLAAEDYLAQRMDDRPEGIGEVMKMLESASGATALSILVAVSRVDSDLKGNKELLRVARKFQEPEQEPPLRHAAFRCICKLIDEEHPDEDVRMAVGAAALDEDDTLFGMASEQLQKFPKMRATILAAVAENGPPKRHGDCLAELSRMATASEGAAEQVIRIAEDKERLDETRIEAIEVLANFCNSDPRVLTCLKKMAPDEAEEEEFRKVAKIAFKVNQLAGTTWFDVERRKLVHFYAYGNSVHVQAARSWDENEAEVMSRNVVKWRLINQAICFNPESSDGEYHHAGGAYNGMDRLVRQVKRKKRR